MRFFETAIAIFFFFFFFEAKQFIKNIDQYSLSYTEKTYHDNVYSKTEPGEVWESRSKSKTFCTKIFQTKLSKKSECFTPIACFHPIFSAFSS